MESPQALQVPRKAVSLSLDPSYLDHISAGVKDKFSVCIAIIGSKGVIRKFSLAFFQRQYMIGSNATSTFPGNPIQTHISYLRSWQLCAGVGFLARGASVDSTASPRQIDC